MKLSKLVLVLVVAAIVCAPVGVMAGDYFLFLQTDKPVYHGGETVVISGRAMMGQEPLMFAAVSLLITGPAGETLYLDQFVGNPDGSYQQNYQLDAQAAQGVYAVSAGIYGSSVQVNFSVGDIADTTPPSSVILSPANGSALTALPLLVTGTATDDTGLRRVEVTLDNGTTWFQASGTSTWRYGWTTLANGSYNIRSRAIDLAGNQEIPTSGIQVTVSVPTPTPSPTPTPTLTPSPTPTPTPTPSPTLTPTLSPTPSPTPSPTSTLPPLPGFPDIANHWARGAIESLAAKGLISGYPDGLFRPDNAVTRAEFVKLLVLASNLELIAPSSPQFNDAPPDYWAFRYIETAAAAGIVQGVGAGRFDPNAQIIRADIATMIARAFQLSPESPSQFSDADRIPAYAADAVGAVSKRGIVNGYPDGSFRPMNLATRAEAATMIDRALALVVG